MRRSMRFIPDPVALALVVLVSAASQGCGNSCLVAAKTYCNQCESALSGSEALLCQCLARGTVSKDDAADVGLEGYFESDSEAERWCSRKTLDLTYAGDDSSASCKASDLYMKRWPDEVCPDTGDDDDSSY